MTYPLASDDYRKIQYPALDFAYKRQNYGAYMNATVRPVANL